MRLPHITNKQQEILLLLYKFRFLNRIQIQTLLYHKNPKNINTWLKDLTDKKYIGRILDTESKINIIPAKYYLSLNGIRFLKDQPTIQQAYLRKIYKEDRRSQQFINRCLFVANIYISLFQKYDSNSFKFFTQSDYSPEGIIKEIFPLFVFRREEDKPYNIVELFTEQQPRFAIRSRITKYISFFTKGDWLNNELSPNVLFICPNSSIEKYIHKFTLQTLDEESLNLNIFISTLEQVQHDGIEGEIWGKIE